jgi:hypothetical protein
MGIAYKAHAGQQKQRLKTIPLHPQTAGRNPDRMLIARSKSKSPQTAGRATRSVGGHVPARPLTDRPAAAVGATSCLNCLNDAHVVQSQRDGHRL